jgi:hypothetical protein
MLIKTGRDIKGGYGQIVCTIRESLRVKNRHTLLSIQEPGV